MRLLTILLGLSFLFCSPHCEAEASDAREIVRKAIDYWRGQTSYTEAEMTVHRPDWERSMSLIGWTKGSGKTLIRFTAPAKDAGSASLTLDDEMWTFSPKINRTVKIPPSMKSQSWMGSDFSYQDLSKADDIVAQYEHKVLSETTHEGKKAFVIESIPHDDAPVVWGKEILKIREDNIIVEHEFIDQTGKPVKKLSAKKISTLGGRLYATEVRMDSLTTADEWTEIVHKAAQFGIDIPDSTFTLMTLSTPQAQHAR